MTKDESIKELKTIPSIGKNLAEDLYNIGIRKISDLKDKDPEELYFKSCAHDGQQHCRCVLYVYKCAVYFANTKNPNPEKLRWNYWKDKK